MFATMPALTEVSEPFSELEASSMSEIPDKVMLKEPLKKNVKKVGKVNLIPTRVGFGVVTKKDDESAPLSEVVRRERRKQKSDVTLVFAIRRPGCGFCREHGLQLTELQQQEDLAMIGVVKGNSADEEHLVEFYTDYFRFSLYSDTAWALYKLMGEKSLGILDMLKGAFGSSGSSRHERKKIVNRHSLTDDGFVEGGILLLDASGELRYAYDESFGYEIDIEALRAAIRSIRASQ
jgi:hypothetical protein